MSGHPDYLRELDAVCLPDVRSPKTDFFTNEPLTITYQYDQVKVVELHGGVPEDIRIQFETTKNLYLYAWFVYRFYPVVKHHAYACLELALRERFEAEMIAAGERKREFGPGLKRLLEHAVSSGVLKDENFSVWQYRTERRAQRRTQDELWEEAQRNGLNEITFDEAQYEVKEVDRDHEYLSILLKTLPWFRNHCAHGTTFLDNQALEKIKLVAEIINQLFPALQESETR